MNRNNDVDTPFSFSNKYLIEGQSADWKQTSVKNFHSIYRGEMAIPEFCGRQIRIAHAIVVKKDGFEIGVSHLRISTWQFDAEGRVDQAIIDTSLVATLAETPKAAQSMLIVEQETTLMDLQKLFAALHLPLTPAFSESLSAIQAGVK